MDSRHTPLYSTMHPQSSVSGMSNQEYFAQKKRPHKRPFIIFTVLLLHFCNQFYFLRRFRKKAKRAVAIDSSDAARA